MNNLTINLLNVLYRSFENILVLFPYVLLGAALSEALKYFSVHNLVKKGILTDSIFAGAFTSIIGMISPLCTFGTIPVVLKLSRLGVPIRILLLFLLSSSMINPQLFLMTMGGIGMDMALMRVISIFFFCILFGFILKKIPEESLYKKNILARDEKEEKPTPVKKFEPLGYLKNIAGTMEYIGFYLLIGVLLGSFLEVFVPDSALQWMTGKGNLLSMVFLGLAGIPLNACGGGTIPLMNAMIHSGVSKGAVLVFFNVGAATRLTMLAGLLAIIRMRILVLYILLLGLFSMGLGYFY